MVTSQYNQNDRLTKLTEDVIDTALPPAQPEQTTSQLVSDIPNIDLTGPNIFQQIETLNEQNAASNRQIGELEQRLKVTNDRIAISATYGFRDAAGDFHRITPNAFHAVVDSTSGTDDGRYKAYVVSLDPNGDVEKGTSSKISANNRAVAQLLGIETNNLDDNAIKLKLSEIANSKSFSATQPSGGSLRAVYIKPDGSPGEFFVPLTIMNSPSFSGGVIGGTSRNAEIGVQAEAKISLPLVQDRVSSQTLQLGTQGVVSNDKIGFFTSAGIQNDRIDPDMLTTQTTQFQAGAGLTTTGPSATISYADQQTDLVTRKTENNFSGRLGLSPYAGPFMKVDADLGTVDVSARINVLPFLDVPAPGAVSLIFTDEGEKSYFMKTNDNTRVVSMQGTNGESRGSIGIAGILPVVVPIAIPGPGLMPARQIELPESTTQALRVGDMSETILGMNQRATDGRFSRTYDLAAPTYTEVFGTNIKLPKATMAVNVLPQSELTSGRFNTIVTNAERELGIKIVENGQMIASRDEIHEAVLKYVRDNNPGLTNKDYLDHLRKKNPELANHSDKQIQSAIEEYAMIAVEKERIPTADELLNMGMKTSTVIPHVDSFTLKAEPRVEIITGKDGQKYIVAQVAINVALIDKQKTEYSRSNGSSQNHQDDKWVVSEQVALLDPNKNLRQQIDTLASQVELTTGMYLQKAFEKLETADNRRLNLNSTRENILKAFDGLRFSRIQNKGEIAERWNQKVSAITDPVENP